MKHRSPPHGITISMPIFMTALLLALSTLSFLPLSAHAAEIPSTDQQVSVNSVYLQADTPDATNTFDCQTATYYIRCYGPKQIQEAYAVTPLLDKGINGDGRTIVIIAAYQSPTIQQDLATFSTMFGLPPANLDVVAPEGVPAWNPNNATMSGWAEEISLDVQWAHAMAPLAKIVLVEAKSSNIIDILNVTKYAVDNDIGDVISQSFGSNESCIDSAVLTSWHAVFEEATRKNITLLASSTNEGAAQPNCEGSSFVRGVAHPASDPLVTAVGGTQLNADPKTGRYINEIGWNEPYYADASGGGYSVIYDRPAYQDGVATSNYRGVPDVSANAALNGGVLVALSFLPETNGATDFLIFGGTSASCPEWAGLVALADQQAQRRLGLINPAIYKVGQSDQYLSAFHDINFGNNTFQGTDTSGKRVITEGYATSEGWDAVTGWGTPIAVNLIPLLDAYTTR